jgi:ABC-2 type transport system permease protein
MIRRLRRYLRLYVLEAWFSYRALFAWSTPFAYLTTKLGFPFFTMLFFIFMGKFVGISDPLYIVIGNILLLPAMNGLSGVSMTIGGERQFGTLSYLLGSPAPRGPIFLGRALFHILDGIFTVSIALPLAMLLFHLDLTRVNFALLLFCVILIAITSSGMGFILGSLSLVNRDGWMITSTLTIALYILIGVNFPVDLLPGGLKLVSYCLPMTRGIMAARQALAGATWASVALLIYGEVLVGVLYTLVGYALFLFIEKRSMALGSLDAL